MLGQAKSTTVVVPPRRAARLPEKKSSTVVVLHTSRSKWVWASMKPGSRSCPSTSMTAASGAVMLRATRRIFSSSTSTSARRVPRPDTTVPPRNRYFMEMPSFSGLIA